MDSLFKTLGFFFEKGVNKAVSMVRGLEQPERRLTFKYRLLALSGLNISFGECWLNLGMLKSISCPSQVDGPVRFLPQ